MTDPDEDVLVAHNKNESREDVEKHIKFVREWYNPSKMDKGKQVVDDQGSQPVASQQNISSVLNDKEAVIVSFCLEMTIHLRKMKKLYRFKRSSRNSRRA